MSLFDSLLLLFFIGAAFTGYRRGVFREVFVTLLWVPTALAIGYVLISSISATGNIDTTHYGLLWTLGFLFIVAVMVIWVLDLAFIQPRFKGSLQSTSRLFYKLGGLGLALTRAWLIVLCGIAVYEASQGDLPPTVAGHGVFLPTLHPQAQGVKDYLVRHGHLHEAEQLEYTDQIFTYQGEVDRAKGLFQDTLTSPWHQHLLKDGE